MNRNTLCRFMALLAGICLLLTACGGPGTGTDGSTDTSGTSQDPSHNTTGKTLASKANGAQSAATSPVSSAKASFAAGSDKAATKGSASSTKQPPRTAAAGGNTTSTKAQGNTGPAASGSAEGLLNAVSLKPVRTNCADLDQRVDEIFAQILRPGMSTYNKVKACFDYLVKNGVYTQNLLLEDVAKDIVYDSSLDANIVSLAYSMLMSNRGVCDHYSAAFVVMTRALGLESYLVTGQVRSQGGGYTGHTWVNIRINGTYYIFDPQVQQNNPGSAYYFFCKTDAQMGDMYRYDDRAGMIEAFGSFRYHPKVSATITVHSGSKTYRASLDQSSSSDAGNVFPDGISVGGDGTFSIDVDPQGGTGQYLCQIGYFWKPGYYVEETVTGPKSFTLQMQPGTNTIQVAVQNTNPDLSVQDAVIFEFAVTYTRE